MAAAPVSKTRPSTTTSRPRSTMSKPETRKLTPEQMQLLMVKPLLTNQEVWGLTGLAKSTVYNMMQVGHKQYDPTFPKSFSLTKNDRNIRFDGPAMRAWLRVRKEGHVHALADTDPVKDALQENTVQSHLPAMPKKKGVVKAGVPSLHLAEDDPRNREAILASQDFADGSARIPVESSARHSAPTAEVDIQHQDALQNLRQRPSSDGIVRSDLSDASLAHPGAELPTSNSVFDEDPLDPKWALPSERIYGHIDDDRFDAILICCQILPTGQVFKIAEFDREVFYSHYSGDFKLFHKKFFLEEMGLATTDIIDGRSHPVFCAFFSPRPMR